MRRPPRSEHGPFGARVLLALVLAVTAGLLAMHGLGPVPALGAHAAPPSASAHATAAEAPLCAPPAHDGGGHMDHADATCAAAGTSTGPALGAPLLPGPSGVTPTPAIVARQGPGAAPGDRAPPSLSELQLLRI
ncbi:MULTISPECIES: DUF6153 family protein [unclassified Streptomyces]|uniref:DUF6153 family protein n=1 Tax=unclassified Streptomyces TaxID=2593676 RepID=UPI002E79001F|nr:DUF6153 family protein [Streptomyces sp. JV176]MEE1800827.1 DUF6153 family protein [Streptomyces sp. JV176]